MTADDCDAGQGASAPLRDESRILAAYNKALSTLRWRYLLPASLLGRHIFYIFSSLQLRRGIRLFSPQLAQDFHRSSTISTVKELTLKQLSISIESIKACVDDAREPYKWFCTRVHRSTTRTSKRFESGGCPKAQHTQFQIQATLLYATFRFAGGRAGRGAEHRSNPLPSSAPTCTNGNNKAG